MAQKSSHAARKKGGVWKILLGLAAGAQNFWYFAKEHMDRTKKEKPKRVGFNSHQ